MKKLIVLLVAVLLVSGCGDDHAEKDNRTPVNLITSDDPQFFEKTVILFENDQYLIKTNLATFINTYPFDGHPDYENIKFLMVQDANDMDVLLMSDYITMPGHSMNALAHHLESGSCLIYDKTESLILEKLEMEWYAEGKPMYNAGRIFYIKGDQFLKTVDLIS